MPKLIFPLAAAFALAGGAALAAPRTYELPEPTAQLRQPKDKAHAAGFEAAQANCLACHSVDYVAMQPPAKGKAFWDAEISKMIKVYHAPITEADSKVISEYLASTY
jgi:sulfite dehydrogenase (cytochrome) subunit B